MYPKNGTAKVKHTINPSNVCPYEPSDQTPKLVIIKNAQAPSNDPNILFNKFFVKNLDASPMKIALPQVKK